MAEERREREKEKKMRKKIQFSENQPTTNGHAQHKNLISYQLIQMLSAHQWRQLAMTAVRTICTKEALVICLHLSNQRYHVFNFKVCKYIVQGIAWLDTWMASSPLLILAFMKVIKGQNFEWYEFKMCSTSYRNTEILVRLYGFWLVFLVNQES